MNRNDKPTLVTSLATAGALTWSAVLVAAFFVFLAAYSAVDHLFAAQRIRATERPVVVETSFYKTVVPAGWACYVRDGDDLRMYRHELGKAPVICYSVRKDRAFRYRALDLNPALMARRLTEHLVALGFSNESNETARVIATDVVQVDPDVSAVRAQFECGAFSGESLYFILDDAAFQVTGIWQWDDRENARGIRHRLKHLFDDDELMEVRMSYPRPVVNSASLSAEEHRHAHELAGNERAMWKLFATRSETEPESVLPAIVHFRKLILLLASIREEEELCRSADYALYEKLMERRKAERLSWELLLDKYRGLGDLDMAIRQTKYIVEQAVLEDEAVLRQNAVRERNRLEKQKAAKASKEGAK